MCRTPPVVPTELFSLEETDPAERVLETISAKKQNLAVRSCKNTTGRRTSAFCFRSTQSFLLRNTDALHPLGLSQMEVCNELKLRSQSASAPTSGSTHNPGPGFSPKKAKEEQRERRPVWLYGPITWLQRNKKKKKNPSLRLNYQSIKLTRMPCAKDFHQVAVFNKALIMQRLCVTRGCSFHYHREQHRLKSNLLSH